VGASLGGALEFGQFGAPQLVQRLADAREPGEVDAVETPVAVPANHEEAGLAQHPEVPAGRRLAEPDQLAELARAPLTGDAQPDELAPSWMRESEEGHVERFGRHRADYISDIWNMQ
jgi:hypothetical protein